MTWSRATGRASARLDRNTDGVRGPRRIAGIARTLIGRYLFPRGLPFHAAAMVKAGRGYLFVGRRCAGKTTVVTRFPGDVVLGDDHALVLETPGGYVLHGTPYAGREGTPCQPGAAPLARILVLGSHGLPAAVEPLAAPEALAALIPATIHVGQGPEEVGQLLDALTRLIAAVPVTRLTVDLEGSLWPMLEAAP